MNLLVAWKKVLVPLAQVGPDAAPRMPGAVLVIWAVLAVLSVVVWGRSVRHARRAWAKRRRWTCSAAWGWRTTSRRRPSA